MSKNCFYCGSNHTIKKGRERGHQRWYCKNCKRYFIGIHKVSTDKVCKVYTRGNQTALDLAEHFGVSCRTIYRRLSNKYVESLPAVIGGSVVVMMDATYWGRSFSVVIMKDAITGSVLWFKFIRKKETLADYKEGLLWLKDHGYNIIATVGDGFKGLRTLLSGIPFQMCQFHQVQIVRTKLTLHPKLKASKELLKLAQILCKTDKESFIGAFNEWEHKWDDFMKERSIDADGKSHYVHKNLRSAYFSIKHNLPWLWTWYDHIELKIPNTNNALEALNSSLKTKLNLHKGMRLEHRKCFIQDFLKAHKPNKQRR